MKNLGAAAVLFAFVVFLTGLTPADAGCVSCGTDGECFDVSEGFSGNCACIIKNRNGVVICTPSGVCDPNQSGTCDEGNNPWVNATPDQEISAKFLAKIDPVDPLLAAALSGAITDEFSRNGLILRRYLLPGEHTGTMGKDGASYRYTVHVKQIAANAFSVSVTVEEEGTSRLDQFEGVLLEKGLSGTFDRIGDKGRSRLVAWNPRDRQK